MTITVGCPQTNRKTDTGKTLKPWPVLVDHYKKRQKAVNELYDAFNLSEIEPGGSVRLETKGDLTILMFRKEAAQ